MRLGTWFVSITVALAVVVSCGGDDQRQPEETPTEPAPSATAATESPTPEGDTPAATETPAPQTSTPAATETPSPTPSPTTAAPTATPTQSPPPTNTPVPATATPVPEPEHHEVRGSGDRWSITSLTVPRGSTVRFSWPRGLPHNVSIPALGYRSGDVGAVGDYTVTFAQPGTYEFFCEAHIETMSGTVVVQ